VKRELFYAVELGEICT